MLTNLIPLVGAELSNSKGMLMAVVTAAGIIVVFSVLVLLIFIFYAYGGIFQAVTASKEKKIAAKKAAEAAAKAESTETKAVDSAPEALPLAETAEGEIPGEIIAVIAAAVAAMDDGKNYVVKKVKRAPTGGRSAWAASGIFENTRPF